MASSPGHLPAGAPKMPQTRDTALDLSFHAPGISHPEADNSPHPPSGAAFSVAAANVPVEGGDPTYGTVTWRTLINGSTNAPKEFVLGIAEFEAHGTLLPHRHAPAEFYFGLEGSGIVTIDGTAHVIAAGTAIYVPGNAEHGVLAGADGLRFAYGFAEPGFETIAYHFSAAALT